jgi:hypothetical protein
MNTVNYYWLSSNAVYHKNIRSTKMNVVYRNNIKSINKKNVVFKKLLLQA